MNGPKVGRGTIYNMSARAIFLSSDFIIHIYFARTLGPEIYGLCGVVLALLAIVAQPLNIGLNQSVSKYVAEDHDRARTLLYQGIRSQMMLVLVLMAIFIGASGPIAEVLHSPELGGYLRLAAMVLPGLGILTIFLGMYNGMRSFGKESLVLSSYPLMRTVAAVTLIYLGYEVRGVLWGFIFGLAVSIILAVALIDVPDVKVDFDVRRLRAFAVPVFILGLVMIVIPNIDLLFVKGMIADKKEAGIYNSARVLAKASYFFFLAVSSTIFPSISGSVSSGDRDRTASYISQGVRYLLMMSLPIACLVAATGGSIISLVFSSNYAEGGESLSILMFGFTLFTLFSVLTTILLAGNRPVWAMSLGLFLLPVDIVLNVILVPRYHLTGAALSTSVTALCGVAVASSIVFREFHTLWDFRSMACIVASSGFVYLLASFMDPSGLWLFPAVIVSMAAYVVLLVLLGELSSKDWGVFMGILHLSPTYSGDRTGRGG
jgi:O-antigen/teichoic acid export membrane protein